MPSYHFVIRVLSLRYLCLLTRVITLITKEIMHEMLSATNDIMELMLTRFLRGRLASRPSSAGRRVCGCGAVCRCSLLLFSVIVCSFSVNVCVFSVAFCCSFLFLSVGVFCCSLWILLWMSFFFLGRGGGGAVGFFL